MRTEVATDTIPKLIEKLAKKDRAALSRLLSLAASGVDSTVLTASLNAVPPIATPIIALTGSGGVGKSSLLGAIAARFTARGENVGVLACDPESPVTSGALLGDRCRIAGTTDAKQVFIRSLPTASGQQGVAQNIDKMLALMKAYGFDRIFVETVGVGQSDVAVDRVADVVVLVLQPQTGDELQWEKAGVMEIADIEVVNKADLPGADQTVADLTEQFHTTSGPATPVVKTSVARNEGIDELCRVLETISESP
jgi:LAO/AO transport system ATPase